MIGKSKTQIDSESIEVSKKKPKQGYTYRKFMFGQITSLFGSEIIGYIMGWYMAIEHGSPFLLAMVMFIQFAPSIIISPIAGVLADKYNRKKIIIYSDFFQAVITAGVATFYIIGLPSEWELGIVYLFIGMRAVCQSIQRPAVGAVLPSIAPTEKLSRLNGLLSLSNGVISLVGPLIALAFLKIPFVETFDVLWIDVITFCIAFVFIIKVPIPNAQNVNNDEFEQIKSKKKITFIQDFKKGVSVTKEIQGISALILIFAFANFLLTPVNTLNELLLIQNHDAGVDQMAFISLFFSSGIIFGSILASVIKKWKHQTFWMNITVIGLFLGVMIVALAPYQTYWVFALGGFITTFGIPIFGTIVNTTLQLVIPNNKMGRFSGFISAIMSIVTPIGYLLSGFLAEFTGISPLFIGASGLAILIIVLIWKTSNIHNLEKMVNEKLTQTQIEAEQNPETIFEIQNEIE